MGNRGDPSGVRGLGYLGVFKDSNRGVGNGAGGGDRGGDCGGWDSEKTHTNEPPRQSLTCGTQHYDYTLTTVRFLVPDRSGEYEVFHPAPREWFPPFAKC